MDGPSWFRFFYFFIVICLFCMCYATLDGKIFRLFSLWRFNEELEKKKLTSVMYAMSRPLPLLFTNTQFLTHLWTANVTTLPTRYDSVKVLQWFGSINSCFLIYHHKGQRSQFSVMMKFYLSHSCPNLQWENTELRVLGAGKDLNLENFPKNAVFNRF